MYVGQPQMPFTPQGFAPGMGGAAMGGGGATMPGMAMPNCGYMGIQQQGGLPANQNIYSMQPGQQQGQWNMSQVTLRTHIYIYIFKHGVIYQGDA